MKKIFYTLFFVSSLVIHVSAQTTNLKFDHIGPEEGLSQSTVNAIVQDALGFMWFGTQDGLNRYDGYTIKVFKHDVSDTNSVSDNRITCLLSDREGGLWIGTMFGGLNRYAISQDKFYKYHYDQDDKSTLNSSTITAIFEDSKNNIWVGTKQGLNLYDRDNDLFIRVSFENDDFPNSVTINSIIEDKSKNLWIGTSKGLYKTDLQKTNFLTDIWKILNNEVNVLFIDKSGCLWAATLDKVLFKFNDATNSFVFYNNTPNTIQTMYEDSNNNLWLGSTYSEVSVLNIQTNKYTDLPTMSLNPSIQKTRINVLYKDKQSTLWIGTFAQGVYVFDWHYNRFKHYLNETQNPYDVKSIVEDQDGILWIGTYGSGLKRFNIERTQFENFERNQIGSEVRVIYESSDKSIWVGTSRGLVHFDKYKGKFTNYKQSNSLNTNGLSNNNITAICEDENGNIWVGNISGGVDYFNRSTGRFTNYFPDKRSPNILGGKSVTSIQIGNDGSVWIGTLEGRLLRFVKETKSFEQISLFAEQNNQQKRAENVVSILCNFIDNDGVLWIGSSGLGLIRFEPETNTVQYFNTTTGLPNNVIYGILQDKNGNFWLSTNKGISCFNPINNTFKNFDSRDGLQSNEFNQGAYFASTRGELFFGGINGFNSFFPDEIKINENIPPVYFTSFKVFDKDFNFQEPLALTKKITLSHSENFFSFEFVALNFVAPEKNKYAYILEAFDKEWHYVTAQQRYASYTNVEPGNYILRVKGSNNDGVWNEAGASLSIIIYPPFWETWWFRGIMFFVVASFIILIYKFRIAQLLKIERMRLKIATDLHDELGSDLSAIALSTQMLKVEDSTDLEILKKIRESSLSAIEAMREIVWFINPKHDSSNELVIKMKNLAETFFNDINYKVNVANNALSNITDITERQNIFLIYKECLTNILRHSNCTTVQVDIGDHKLKDNELLLRIIDDGTGFEQNKVKKGSGLNNLQTRAKRLNAILKIESSINHGTIIELKRKNDAHTS